MCKEFEGGEERQNKPLHSPPPPTAQGLLCWVRGGEGEGKKGMQAGKKIKFHKHSVKKKKKNYIFCCGIGENLKD